MTRISDDVQARLYRGFCAPHEPFDFEWLETLTVGHYRRVVYTFLSRFGTVVEKHSEGVVPLLRAWLEGPATFDLVWDASFGRIRELLSPPSAMEEEGSLPAPRLDEAEIMERTAGLMLRLCEQGTSGAFRIALPGAARLRWGRWQAPPADSIEVESDGRHARIVCTLEDTPHGVTLDKVDDWIATGAVSLPTVEWGGRPILVNPGEDPAIVEVGGHLPIDANALPEAIAQLEAALAVIDRHAPVYAPWVRRVLRQLVPSAPVIANDMVSGSFVHRPGVIMLSSPMSVVVAAELLAHEACHQHFWLLVQAGAVEDGTDREKRHFSPYVSAMRDLRMMLMTYHAFGNAVIFHRQCREGGLADPVGYARERQFTELFDPYERVLSEADALTPLGRVLWETVAERLGRRSANVFERACVPAGLSSTVTEGV